MEQPVFAIVDGHAQFFRAYFAIRGGMSSPVTSEPTQMAFGFLNMLLRLYRQMKPQWLVVVIDAAGDRGTFRSEIYPEYKANRDDPPDDFDGQVKRCLEALDALRVPVLAVERVEADDVIATLVRRCRRERPEVRIRIISKDKDLAQLLDEQTTLYDVSKETEVTAESLFETKGVRPENIVDMLTLMGDSVDNVPGVAGIGPKTAAALILKYGTVEGVLENLADMTPKRREAIEAARDVLPMSRRLVQLKEDCEFEFDWDRSTADPTRADGPRLSELLRLLGFRTLRDEMGRLVGGGAPPAPAPVVAAPEPDQRPTAAAPPPPRKRRAPNDDAQLAPLFAGEPEAQPALPKVERRTSGFTCIRTEAELALFLTRARQAAAAGTLIALDTETDGLSTTTANLVGVSLSFKAGEAVYLPLRSPDPGSHMDLERARPLLQPFLADGSIQKVGHNLKFDLQVLERHGFQVAGLAGDSMVASFLVDPTRTSHGMDALAESLLDHRCIPLTDLIGKGVHQRTFDQVDLDVATEYAAEDAEVTWRLAQLLTPQVEAAGMGRLYREVEVPLVSVLASMESAGMRVDAGELERQRMVLEKELQTLRERIDHAAPHPINPDSPRQLAAALFNRPEQEPPGLGLKSIKRTPTGPSTDSEVLQRLADDPQVTTPLPGLVLEYRQLAKLVGTYLIALGEAIDKTDGRIHTRFHQTGAATGRLSSSEPNLQNIPIRTEVGRRIRRAFVAAEGCALVSADYSQIELRMLAHLSQDPALIEAFRQGRDIHASVAAEVHGVALEAVTPEQRDAAKMVNFGIVYGITAWGLARRLGSGTGVERAREIIDSYKARFRGIESFLRACVEQARRDGFVTTILGRRRPVPQVHSKNPGERALGERVAINSVVQGSAADLIKVAMVRLHRELPGRAPGARLILQIHDELVLESPTEQAEAACSLMKLVMEGAMDLRVPLRVGTSIASDWSDS